VLEETALADAGALSVTLPVACEAAATVPAPGTRTIALAVAIAAADAAAPTSRLDRPEVEDAPVALAGLI
jgi:hypothetical protein